MSQRELINIVYGCSRDGLSNDEIRWFLTAMALMKHVKPEMLGSLAIRGKAELSVRWNMVLASEAMPFVKYLTPGIEASVRLCSDMVYDECIRLFRECTAQEIIRVALREEYFTNTPGYGITTDCMNDLLVGLADIEPGQTILDATMGCGGTLLRAYEEAQQRLSQRDEEPVEPLPATVEELIEAVQAGWIAKDGDWSYQAAQAAQAEQTAQAAQAEQTPQVVPATKLVGQDHNPLALAMAYVNLLVHGVRAEDMQLFFGDVFTDPAYLQEAEYYDRVIEVVPFSAPMDAEAVEAIQAVKAHDKRYAFGPINRLTGDWMLITSSITALNPKGKAVLVVPPGVLFKGGSPGKIRDNVLNQDLLETVITLPSGLLRETGVPIAIVVCNNHKSESMQGKVQLIKVEEDMTIPINGRDRLLSKEVVNRMIDVYHSKEEVDNFATTLPREDLKDGILLPHHYLQPTKYIIDEVNLKVDYNALEQTDTMALGSIVHIGRGLSLTSQNEDEQGDYQVVRISDIDDKGQIDYTQLMRTTSRAGKVQNYLLEKGDLLLSIRGISNKVGLVEEDRELLLFNANLVRLRLKSDRYRVAWLKLYLSSVIGQWFLTRMARGTTVQQITLQDLKELPVPKVSVEDQEQMLRAQEEQERELAALEEQVKEKKEQMKKNAVVGMGWGEAFTVK